MRTKFKIQNLKLKIKKIFLNQNKNRGVTLIELLMYMGLFSLFMVVLTQLFSSSLETRLDAEGTSAVDSDTTFIYHHLKETLFQAESISTPVSYGSPGNTLTITVDGTAQTYSLQGNNLVKTIGADTDQVNSYATRVTAFSVERMRNTLGNDSVRLNITLESTIVSQGQPEQRVIQTTLGTRYKD